MDIKHDIKIYYLLITCFISFEVQVIDILFYRFDPMLIVLFMSHFLKNQMGQM